MRFNKEEKTKRVFLIDFEEVSEDAFYSTLEEAITNEYDEGAFTSYLRDNYCDVCIEGWWYDAFDILNATGHYDSAYDEWLDGKTQDIIDEFKNGVCSSMCIYGSDFEIKEIEEAFINIELTQHEANMLYLALNIRSTTTMKETFNKMLSEVVESEVK